MTALLEVERLFVRYPTARGPAEALDGVSLTIGEGEVVGLVGESGCGKTTLARAVLGILGSGEAEGAIRFHGQDLLALPPGRVRREIRGRAITFVPQDPFGSLHPLYRVGDQIADLMAWKAKDTTAPSAMAECLALFTRRRRPGHREAAIAMLRDVQIPNPEQALTKLPSELSGGQRQRLTIAMALLPQPQLILADEPTTALDVTIQAQVLRLLHGLVREKKVSMLFTTHDLGVASEICDRIVVMYAGQEAEVAPTRSFFAAPRHPYTAALLQSLPNEAGVLRDIPGSIPALVQPPGGCRFHPRCPNASARCAAERPPPVEVAPGHVVRCWHPVAA
jgi:oligopeptide/dipeptide ABC transporter ATP-binding protein